MLKTALVFHDNRRDTPVWRHFYDKMGAFYEKRGFRVLFERTVKESIEVVDKLQPDVVCMWNGHQEELSDVKDWIRKKERVQVIAENGFMPQCDKIILDNVGISGSALKNDEQWDWTAGFKPQDFLRWKAEYINKWFESYSTGSYTTIGFSDTPPKPYIAVLGQLDNDNAMKYANGNSCKELYDYVCSRFHPDIVWLRPHPKANIGDSLAICPATRIIKTTRLHPLLYGSSLVVSYNSTATFDALIHRANVAACGSGPWPHWLVQTFSMNDNLLNYYYDGCPNDNQLWLARDMWLDYVRRIQIDKEHPSFDHPRNERVLLGN